MATLWVSCLQRFLIPMFARTGIHSTLQGSGGPPDGVGGILLCSLLGAFCGLVAGLVLLPVVRYAAFLVGRNIGGASWVIAGSVLGALLFGSWAYFGEKE